MCVGGRGGVGEGEGEGGCYQKDIAGVYYSDFTVFATMSVDIYHYPFNEK